MDAASTSSGKRTIERELSVDVSFRHLHRRHPDRYPFLLESTATGPQLGKFDILFACPGEALTLDDLDSVSGSADSFEDGPDDDFLRSLDTWWRAEETTESNSGFPFRGGWFLYLGYELAGQIEPVLELKTDPDFPVAFAVRCRAALIREHSTGKIVAIGEPGIESDIEALLMDALSAPVETADSSIEILRSVEEEKPDYFLDAVRSAKELVTSGDIYQANLSRAWTIEVGVDVSASDVYSRLCDANPAPFAGIARWKECSIISSSPERLVTSRHREISTRPIAGTRPRGDTHEDDTALSAELFGHPKERAEHIMLIDLERNDLGRVCKAGTVEVDEYMVLESYAHVHHIVSNVRGTLMVGVTPGDAIRAVFPGGTITGCPKVRCMEIISNLEHSPRGAYTGSFGYLNTDGSLDLNILIRTMVMRDNKIQLRAGSGIVADSVPEAELDETRAKAKGLLMALR
jgi:anthranilate synthase component 1